MYKCVRKLHFCSGHRVFGHENKCAKMHGHNYVAWIYATSKDLDSIGRVVDFSVLKSKVGGWVEENWDHKFLLWQADTAVSVFAEHFSDSLVLLPFNPTAENMAMFLLDVANELLDEDGVFVYNVELYETENCKAVFSAQKVQG